MVSNISELFQELAAWGIMDSLLPFILVFTIIYAILQKAKLFGDSAGAGGKKVNIVIALAMALAVVIPHVMGVEPDVVNIINRALPQVSIVVIAIIMVLLIIGIWAPNIGWAGGVQGWTVLIALGLVLYIFGNSAGLWEIPAALWFLNDSGTQSLVVIFLIFAVIIWFITREERPAAQGDTFLARMGRGGDAMAQLFGVRPRQ